MFESYFNDRIVDAIETDDRIGQPSGRRVQGTWKDNRDALEHYRERAYIPVPGVSPEDL